MSAGEFGTDGSRGRIGGTWSRLTATERRSWTLLLGVAWVVSTAFVAWRLNQDWVPHDDGSFAQSAQRVLDGQLPHRDFAELYTGGLTFLNAGVFALFGQNLIWLRIPMFLLFVAYVPCVYLLARRFSSTIVAVLAAAFAVTWGLPTYPGAVPSWYLLFFSVFGALALVKHLETGCACWLVVAGLFGGLSISFKIVGVWYVIAVLLFLLFVEQETRTRRNGGRLRVGGYGLCVVAFTCLSLALVFSLMRSHFGTAEIVTFLLPLGAVGGLVILNEARLETTRSTTRFADALRLVGPFSIGVAVPLVALAIPFVVTQSVGDLLVGVFVSPQSRLEDTSVPPPGLVALVVAAPVALALVGRYFVSSTVRRAIDITCVAALAILVATAGNFVSFGILWNSMRALAPLIVVGGIAVLWFVSDRAGRSGARGVVFLLLALSAFSSLVQFPFAAPIYFHYVAPLFALAAIAAFRYAGVGGGLLPVALLVSYTLFGFVWLDWEARVGRRPLPSNTQLVILDHQRGSIRVNPLDRAMYRRVAELLVRHRTGEFTYAGPDAPEVYFLSGLKNPTRSLFDHLDTSGSARGDRLLETLEQRGVTAIAINLDPPTYSDRLDPTTLGTLRADYPSHERVGRFDVRWQAPDR